MVDVRPVQIASLNCTFQRGNDAALIRDVAQTPVHGHRPDVLNLVECRTGGDHPRPINVAAILPGWDVCQVLTSGPRAVSLAGSVIAVRRGVGLDVRRHRLIPLSPAGRGVQARHQMVAIVDAPGRRVFELAAGHLAVLNSGVQDDGLRSVQEWRTRAGHRRARARERGVDRLWHWGGDANMNPALFARAINAQGWTGDRPMVNAWSGGWRPDPKTGHRRERAADHLVIYTLWTP